MTRHVHRSSGAIQDRRVPWRFRLTLFALLPVTILLQLLAGAVPEAVERYYSRGLYPHIVKFVSAFSEWTALSLVEFVILLFLALTLFRVYRAIRGLARKRRTARNVAAQALSGLLALTGLLYAWGVFAWGFNYQRVPFVQSQQLDISPATPIELRLLCEGLARDAGELRETLSPIDGDRAMERTRLGFEELWPDYPDLHGAHVTRVKRVTIPIFGWLGLGGVFSPYTSEANVNAGQPLPEVLASGCHELAHQAGWAREEEASFVGFAACRRHPDAELRYAVTQSALRYCATALVAVDPDGWREMREKLHPGIRQDWDAIRDYWLRRETPIADVAEKVNDTYLKSQGQKDGVGSYRRFVDLLIGDLRRSRKSVGAEGP